MKGSIVKRGGRYSVVVELDRDPVTGRRRREWHSGFSTRRDAEAARVEILGRLQRGEYVTPSKLTLASFLEGEWLPATRGSLRASTFTSYKLNVRRVTERLGSTPLQRLSPAALNKLYAELGDYLSPRTVRYVHTVLRKALADAVKWNRLAKNPADLATPPSARAAKAPAPKTWTADELRAFLTSVRVEPLYPLWLTYATTGLRRSEALGLTWRAVDLDGATVRITNARIGLGGEVLNSPPKSGHGRAVALDNATVEALRAHRRLIAAEKLALGPDYRDEGWVFCRADGSPLLPDYVSKAFQTAVKRAGLPRIRLHDLRHGWASLALSAGVNPKVVSERLGHATVGFTLDVYSHVLPGLQEDAAAKVAALVVEGAS